MNKKDCAYVLKWSKKIKALKFLGGECSICGDKKIMHLDFHHLRDKNRNISYLFSRGKRWSDIESEISKCILLCRNCHGELHSGKKRYGIKIKFLEYKNIFSCQICGYKGKNYASLDFHHREKESKIFSIGNAYRFITTMMEEIEKEIDKCDVICRNCHRSLHFDINRFLKFKSEIYDGAERYVENKKADWKEISDLNESGMRNFEICKKTGLPKSTISTVLSSMNIKPVKAPSLVRVNKCCLICEKEFTCNGSYQIENQRYCSRKCKSIGDMKLNLSKEELSELLKTENYSSLSRKFNVAPNTVKNLAKRYGLI